MYSQLDERNSAVMEDRRTTILLAYGRTGSGKTYTLTNVTNSIIRDVFASNQGTAVEVSGRKIYLSRLLDLTTGKECRVNAVTKGSWEFDDVKTFGDDSKKAIKIMEDMQTRRKSSGTLGNRTSSRSHAIYILVSSEFQDPSYASYGIQGIYETGTGDRVGRGVGDSGGSWYALPLLAYLEPY